MSRAFALIFMFSIGAHAAEPAPEVLTASTVSTRGWKSAVGLGLGAGGAIAIGTGVARLLQSVDYAYRERQYPSLLNEQETVDYDWIFSQWRNSRNQGLVLVGAGAAALVGSVVLIWLDTPKDLSATVMLDGQSTGLVFHGTF